MSSQFSRLGLASRNALRSTAMGAAFVPALAFAAADQVDSTDYWRVVDVTGEARMLAGANAWNTEATLAPGDVVGPYQSISTGPDGSAILARGEDIIVVYENSTIEVPPPAEGNAETEIVQSTGSAYYAVDPRPEPHFEVQTPHLIVGVKGTQFALSENGAALAVVEGLVNAGDTASGARSDVPAGQGVGAANGRNVAPRRSSAAKSGCESL